MKRVVFFLLFVCGSTVFGQHFKLQHATFRMWTSQSNVDQRGAEYRITLLTLKKVKNLTFSKIWIAERCFTIEAVVVDNKEAVPAQNMNIAKGKTIKILMNVKEIRNEKGEWVLNSELCENGSTADNQGKATIEYSVGGTRCTFSIADFEMLPSIQYQ